jgi:hypothetical protein
MENELFAIRGLSGDDVIALCVYRGGPQATLETDVRGKSVYHGSNREAR